ncbi:L-aspartate oxidase [Rhizobium etli]|uniref:L-aspartate oxidase n=1 Tax=Rhizobium etli TaxID=29449 RepID=UPI0003839275|nr:L-aspartate oxidase [Rhizobium etli]AGS24568.1 L-aspartate oxidase 1 [Rhizobium etli bv. mimosae str. Mim1]
MTEVIGHLAGRVAIVGSGIAGLMTALTLAPQPVVLISRACLGAESSSAWAQGGIAASLGLDDSIDLHVADTLAAGDGLCDTEAVTSILSEARTAIAVLERFGVHFDRKSDGALALGLEAAHCRRRIAHVEGDGSGAAIVRALVIAARRSASITMVEGAEVRRLLLTDGRLSGLLVENGGKAAILQTSQVVLATGGIGGLYDASTNPNGNFGQGIMLAARAGADLADMEFVQFHPTALASQRRPLALVSEAVRGEGAVLVNERGERFLAGEPGAELAPRDKVARAIGAELARGGRVFLDARSALGQAFGKRFPGIARLCNEAGIDPTRERIPVRPAAHYHMGGVATNLHGRSSVDGLWVVGEAASSGLHGANRLASNSLLEAAVMGMRAARDIAGLQAPVRLSIPKVDLPAPAGLMKVRPIVSRHLGVLRNAGGLESAILNLLPHIDKDVGAADAALVALAIAVFASHREESRGAHARSDFPEKCASAERRRMSLAAILDAAHAIASRSVTRRA